MITLKGLKMTSDKKDLYKAMTNTELLKEYKSKREIYSEAKADKATLEAEIIERMKIKQGQKKPLRGKGIAVHLDWSKTRTNTDWEKIVSDFKIDKDKYPKIVATKNWSIV